jgi:hypothetical protein
MPSKLVQAVQDVRLLGTDAVVVLHERLLCRFWIRYGSGLAWLLMMTSGDVAPIQASAGR